MNRIKKLFVSLFISTVSLAQTEAPFIEVNSIHKLEVTPNEIFISIHIVEKGLDKQKITVETQQDNLIKSLKNIGVGNDNLTLTNTLANWTTTNWKRSDLISEKYYLLKVTTTTQIAKVFNILDSLDIRDARIDHVSHSNIEELKKQSQIEAIKKAKEKATYLTTAIGQQVGKPLIIRDCGDYTQHTLYNRNFALAEAYDTQNNIEFQKIIIESNIYVKFEIK